MKFWKFVVAGCLACVVGVYALTTWTTESQSNMERLLEKERSTKTSQANAQLQAKKEQRQKEQQAHEAAETLRNEKEAKAIFKSAIPGFPEMSWKNTRVFNLSLNNPPIASAKEAYYLLPEDTVCGVLVGEQARAYPWFVLSNYHAVNDHIGDEAVIVNLCEACNGGAAFSASVAGTTLDFRPRGIKNGTWYAVDFQTGSSWYPFIGEAFDGPLKGTKLKRLRIYFSTWRDWVRDHPQTTVVLSNDEVRTRPHGVASHMASAEVFNPAFMKRMMGARQNPKRDWMASHTLVFGFIPKEGQSALAYTMKQLQEAESPFQFRFGDVPVILFVQNQYQIGAYVRQLGDTELQLSVESEVPLRMSDQRGNQWDAWGRAISGPDQGSELAVVDGYLAKWFEWIENFPSTKMANSR